MKKSLLKKGSFKRMMWLLPLLLLLLVSAVEAQPTISYTTNPQFYTVGTAITPLSPTSSGVGATLYTTPVTVASGFGTPSAITADAAGNIYLIGFNTYWVGKIPAGSSTLQAFYQDANNFQGSVGITTDASGNVYTGNYKGTTIEKISPSGIPVGVLYRYTYLPQPQGLAIDAAGNLYLAIGNSGAVELPTGGSPPVTLPVGTGFVQGIAVDAAGNIYAAVTGQGQQSGVREIPVGSSSYITVAAMTPQGLAVDALGNVFAGDAGNIVAEIPFGTHTIDTLGTGFTNPTGIAVDPSGNVWVTDGSTNGAVKEMTRSGGYFIEKQLPAGLILDPKTGIISGTPTTNTATATYAIDAYNGSGYSRAFVTINVNGPPIISYSGPQTYSSGIAITPLTPTSENVSAPGYSSSTLSLGSGFSSPVGVATDAAGNVYVADAGNHAVKKIPVGSGTPVILASGFNTLAGIAADAAGNVYVSDSGDNTVQKIPAGSSTPVILASGFNDPIGVAVDATGNVFVADYLNNSIDEIPFGGGTTKQVMRGEDGPSGIAVDGAGNLYASLSNGIVNKAFSDGHGSYSGDYQLANPINGILYGIAVDPAGNVYVTSQGDNLLYLIRPGANFPSAYSLSPGFIQPYGVAIDAAGNLYVADYGSNTVNKIQQLGGYYLSSALPAGLSFDGVSGAISGTPTKPGPATNYTVTAYNNNFYSASATINIAVNAPTTIPSISYNSPQTYTANVAITPLAPTGSLIAGFGYSTTPLTVATGYSGITGTGVDAAGNVYFCDGPTRAIVKMPAGGGAPVTIGSALNTPGAIAVDAAGDVYIADTGDKQIEKLPAGGGSIIIVATGLFNPKGIAVDAAGNLYVADDENVKKILAGGGTVVLNSSVYSSYGAQGIAVDAAGNVYVAPATLGALYVIHPGGNITTLGINFKNPTSLAIDAAGNLYVTDSGDNNIKIMFPPDSHTIWTVASGFNQPQGISMDAGGNLYIVDQVNTVVKELKPVGGYYLSSPLPAGLHFDTNRGAISGIPTAASPATDYTVTAYNYGSGGQAVVNIAVTLPPAPTISYTGPQTYTQGTAITPLLPTSAGVAAPAYSGSPVPIGSGFSHPWGMATDAAGDLYVVNASSGKVQEFPAGGGAPVTVTEGFGTSFGLTVDAADNLYVATESSVIKIPAGGGAPATLAWGFARAYGIAVDAAGNVYVSDTNSNIVERLPTGGGAPVVIGNGFNGPAGVAVDAAGNVFVADAGNGALKEIPVDGSAVVTLASGLFHPGNLTVDAAGNIFLADGNSLLEFPSGTGTPVILASGFADDAGVAVDGAGNVYTADEIGQLVEKIKPLGGYYLNTFLPAGLNFNTATGAISGTPTASSPASNYTITAYNNGVGGQANVNITVTETSTAVNTISAGANTLTNAALLNYMVTFSNPEPGLTATNFSLITSGLSGASIGTPVTTDNIHWTVPVNTGTGQGTIQLSLANATGFSFPVTTSLPFAGQTYTIDKIPPTVIGITRYSPASSALINAASVIFKLSFSKPVTGFQWGDLNESQNGVYTYQSESPNSMYLSDTWLITLGGIIGSGSLGLNMNSDVTDITDLAGNTLSGSGFTGELYNIDKIRPSVTVSAPSSTTIGTGGPGIVTYTVTYADDNFNTSNLTTSGITLKSTGTATGTLDLSGSGTSYTVTISNITGLGTLGISIGAGHASDLAGNADLGAGPSSTFIVASTDATLAGLSLSAGTFRPVFAPGTVKYSVVVNHQTPSIKVTPTANGPGASIKINGVTVASGSASNPIPLAAGNNTITVAVTAQDGIAIDTYTIVAYRVPSADVNLASIQPGTGTLSPRFSPGTLGYTANVHNSVTSLTVTPTADALGETIKVNGIAVASGSPSGAITLSVGANTIATVVTAQDGSTTKTYTITVTRAASTNANLTWIHPSAGALIPSFSFLHGTGPTDFTLNVGNSITSMTVTPTTADATATVKVNGAVVTSGTASQSLPLAIGPNTITAVVTAQDGTTKTYTLTVTRANGPVPVVSLQTFITLPAVNNNRADGITVHQGVSPNGDGANDVLTIDGINNYPDNMLRIMSRSGALVYEAKGYDNTTRVFDGHSTKTGKLQQPGTYFYSLEYKADGVTKYKTGFIILKY